MNKDQLADFNRKETVNVLEKGLMQGRVTRRSFISAALAAGFSVATANSMAAFAEKARDQQALNRKNLKTKYDFIVCGAGSAGCVVARRLAENPEVNVLLLEAGGTDQIPEVLDGTIWFKNPGTERVWQFKAQPTPTLNGRTPDLPMGKILGGGSSVNGLVWARGHKNDWNDWASFTKNDAWGYESVLDIYRRIEDWQGPDSHLRGKGGNVIVDLPRGDINPVCTAMIDAARDFGMPTPVDLNGEIQEGIGGAGLPNLIMKDGRRCSMSQAYVNPYLDRPNLTVLLGAEVNKLKISNGQARGVEFEYNGEKKYIEADMEIILSAGSINTPKIMMLSGVGPEAELAKHGIKIQHKLEGVGQNFQDHILLGGCMYESPEPVIGLNNSAEFTYFWKSDSSVKTPDIQPFLEEFPLSSEITRKQFNIPEHAWTFAAAIVKPTSRGHVTIADNNPRSSTLIYPNFLSTETDIKALERSIEICRELADSDHIKPFRKREVMPGNLKGEDLVNFMRNAAGTYWHQVGTCKMGVDDMSVADGNLNVYGVDKLRIADGSVMPETVSGNTMAACVVIGERCAEEIKKQYSL